MDCLCKFICILTRRNFGGPLLQVADVGTSALPNARTPGFQPRQVSNVQVEVSFLRRVKGVKAILVSLPENYRHDIQHKNQLPCKHCGQQFDLPGSERKGHAGG